MIQNYLDVQELLGEQLCRKLLFLYSSDMAHSHSILDVGIVTSRTWMNDGSHYVALRNSYIYTC